MNIWIFTPVYNHKYSTDQVITTYQTLRHMRQYSIGVDLGRYTQASKLKFYLFSPLPVGLDSFIYTYHLNDTSYLFKIGVLFCKQLSIELITSAWYNPVSSAESVSIVV